MAGIYIHIPFCKQACHYCDFHFSTNLKHKDEMVTAISQEIVLRNAFLHEEEIQSVYFGGGTPSILPSADIKAIFASIERNFSLASYAEITLEANPDDIRNATLKEWRSIGINRLSIGVQSFIDRDLQWMNRAHQAQEAVDSIRRAQDHGFENISIDLIYGMPGLTDQEWKQNIHTSLDLGIPHISSYALTVEQNTALDQWIRKGKIKALDEEQAASQFEILMDELLQSGFEHYEISNFCKPNFHSRHNSSYWQGKKYLGIGPSAHSFDQSKRSWNVRNNHQYIARLSEQILPSIEELLSITDRLNEYLMLGLRTAWGISRQYIRDEFGSSVLNTLEPKFRDAIDRGLLQSSGNTVTCTQLGKLLADGIASDLFILDHDEIQ